MGVIAEYLVNGAAPSSVGGTGTTIKYFADLPGRPNWFTNGTTVNSAQDSLQQGNTPSATSALGQLRVPSGNRLNGSQWNLLVSGTVGSDTGDPSGTVSISVKANTGSESSPNYVTLGTIPATAPTFASAENWFFEFTLCGDSASGLVQGFYSSMLGGAFNNTGGTAASVKIDNNLTGINFNAGGPGAYPFGLVVGVTFGTSDPSNTASLYQFQIFES